MTDTPQEQFRRTDEEAARRGHPSYVWRAGQERRLALVRQWAKLEGARILDNGCGVGMYTARFCQFSPHVAGVEIDPAVAAEARRADAGRDHRRDAVRSCRLTTAASTWSSRTR